MDDLKEVNPTKRLDISEYSQLLDLMEQEKHQLSEKLDEEARKIQLLDPKVRYFSGKSFRYFLLALSINVIANFYLKFELKTNSVKIAEGSTPILVLLQEQGIEEELKVILLRLLN